MNNSPQDSIARQGRADPEQVGMGVGVLSRVVEMAREAIVVLDAAGVVVQCSQRAEEMLGFSAEELIGSPLDATLSPSAEIQAAIATPSESSEAGIDTYLKHKGGGRLDVSVSIGAVATGGDATRVLVIRDDTSSRRLKRAVGLTEHVEQILSSSQTIDGVLPAILGAFSRSLGAVVAEAWLRPDDEHELELHATEIASATGMRAVGTDRSDTIALVQEVLECGAPVWIEIDRDPSWRAAVGIPIAASGTPTLVVAVMYFEDPWVSRPLPDQILLTVGRDVGNFVARGDAERALALNAGRLRDAVRRAAILVGQFDVDLRYTWVAEGNPAYPPEAVVGGRDADILPADSARILSEAKRQAIADGELASVEIDVPVGSEIRRFAFHLNPIRDRGGGDGPVVGLSIVGLDITEVHLSHLRHTRIAAIVTATTDLVLDISPDGTLLSVNPAARKLLGLEDGDALDGLRIADFLTEEGLRHFNQEEIPHASESPGKTWQGESIVMSRTGDVIPLSQVVIAHADMDGGTSHISIIGRDLRERLRREREMRGLTDTFSAVIENLPKVVFVLDRAGRVTFTSTMADKLIGGLGLAGMPPEIERRTREAMESGNDYRPTEFKDAVALRYDGRMREFLPLITTFRLPENDQLAALLVLQDITEFHMLDRVKSDLIATVSHELRTPIAGIQLPLLIALEERTKNGKLTDQQRKLLLSSASQVERLLNTLNLLLDMTRFNERGEVGLDAVASAPRDLLEDALAAVSAHVADAAVEVEIDAPEDLARVAVDPPRIQHVITNLINNAVSYSPHGLKLTLGAVEVSDGIRFFVRDNGRGIDERYHARLFDRFFKVPGGSGSGLGLSIVREFVQAHGGTVSVESELGEGSTFYFTLPKAKQQSAPHGSV